MFLRCCRIDMGHEKGVFPTLVMPLTFSFFLLLKSLGFREIYPVGIFSILNQLAVHVRNSLVTWR